MRTILALLLAASTSAHAAVIGVAEAGDGSAVMFHDDAGPCVGAARQAVYVGKAGERIPGCWVTDGVVFKVVFLDTDLGTIPVSAVKPEKKG